VALGLAGAVLLWSGLHGASVSGSLRSLLQGRAPSESGLQRAAEPLPTSGRDKGNLQLQAGAYGWGSGNQWSALQALWPSWQAPGAGDEMTEQVRAGLAYIAATYGTPVKALEAKAVRGSY